MKIRDTDYLYATMRVRANEKSLLNSSQISRMVSAKTPEEAAKILSEAGYSDVSLNSLSDIFAAVTKMQAEAYELVGEVLDNAFLRDVFLLKYDFHNIKVAVKARLTGEDPTRLMSDFSIIPKDELLNAVRTGDMSALPEKMSEAIKLSEEKLSHTGNAQMADFVLDAACFDMMRDAAIKSGSEFLVGYVKLMCDVANLRTAVRVRRQKSELGVLKSAFVPGGETDAETLYADDLKEVFFGTLLQPAASLADAVIDGKSGFTEFERELDSALVYYMQSAKYVAFDERPIVAYLAAKETEAQAVRIIMAGKFENLSPDQIQSRLRGIKNG
ncbi:MAG: V-type ATPase subunit [Oscillospiraceae bacterium]|nr:V-type ATPase subunit [Oscillospiraceae bacterium]